MEKVVQKFPNNQGMKKNLEFSHHIHIQNPLTINISLWCLLYNIWACHSPEDPTIVSTPV